MSNHELSDFELRMIGLENLRNFRGDPEAAAEVGFVPINELSEHISQIPEHRAKFAAALGQTAVHPETQTPVEAPVAYDGKSWGVNWSNQTPAEVASKERGLTLVREALAAKKKL